MFLNLFLSSSQAHNYGTRAANYFIDFILVEQILSNLQSFTKVPKSGILSQYQLLLYNFKTKMLPFLMIYNIMN